MSGLCWLCVSAQLRSAGAAVIQEFFPRVSSIATLDITDNGTMKRCSCASCCDLSFLSLLRRALNTLLMDHATLNPVYLCACVLTGLDADLLTVLPAISRHPSLKHLHLGKNFNIKNRCCLRSISRCTAVIYGCSVFVRICAANVSLNKEIFNFKTFFKQLPFLGRQLRSSKKLTCTLHVCVFLSMVCVCRVLDEVLQKLVSLIQEEECVSDHPGSQTFCYIHTSGYLTLFDISSDQLHQF